MERIASGGPAVALTSESTAGTFVEQLTEEIDIFPSLVQLHGFDVPADLEVKDAPSRRRHPALSSKRGVPCSPCCLFQGQSWIPLLAGQTQSRVATSQYPHSCSDQDDIKVVVTGSKGGGLVLSS
jgi:hypothetical protein